MVEWIVVYTALPSRRAALDQLQQSVLNLDAAFDEYPALGLRRALVTPRLRRWLVRWDY